MHLVTLCLRRFLLKLPGRHLAPSSEQTAKLQCTCPILKFFFTSMLLKHKKNAGYLIKNAEHSHSLVTFFFLGRIFFDRAPFCFTKWPRFVLWTKKSWKSKWKTLPKLRVNQGREWVVTEGWNGTSVVSCSRRSPEKQLKGCMIFFRIFRSQYFVFWNCFSF